MSTKFSSPLLGYNNNVRHKGRVFHIQTEDSGIKYGHVITHLFMDGGRILKSVKTSYAEYAGTERMADVVRELMKQQHKAMFIALRDGRFDGIVDGGADVSQATRALAAESPPSTSAPLPAAPSVLGATGAADRTDRYVTAGLDPEDAPATIRQVALPELTLDIESLERAATGAQSSSSTLRGAGDLPPPPANIFRERTATGKYRIAPLSPEAAAASADAPDAVSRPSPGAVPSTPTPAERRYAPTRPASIFGQARLQQGKSIFGEDLMSDKSLDEVILSYLAEDLADKKK